MDSGDGVSLLLLGVQETVVPWAQYDGKIVCVPVLLYFLFLVDVPFVMQRQMPRFLRFIAFERDQVCI